MNIDTSLIFQAIKHYEEYGYNMVTVPMLVDEEASRLTKPKGCKDLYHKDKVYVASAEQSFIQLYNEGELMTGKYMALTPCYRDEPELDDTHFNIFLKLELIKVYREGYKPGASVVLDDAYDFFKPLAKYNTKLVSFGNNNHDIEINGLEVGSYGYRQFSDGTWYVYGTGIAEPRLSYALGKSNDE
ncbi:hypothetical protein NVP2275O_309 [Vibrio phage 2.275.O._10N.286.54.E11]|nr:hypothetical protein NVP2275O_309 [Vibrio phage 2.275.O._10N.286.54.E11]